MKFSYLFNNSLASLAVAVGIYFPFNVLFNNFILAVGAGGISGIAFFIYMRRRLLEMEKKESPSVKANTARYMQGFAITMGSYITFLFTSIYLLGRVEGQVLQILIALLPMLPVTFGLWTFMQWVRNLDEFQQKIQFEAIAFSLGMTGVVTFTIGFLENAGIPQLGLIWVFPMIIAFWGIGLGIATRRYE